MKRMLLTASAVATFAIPALCLAHQEQDAGRPERAAPAQKEHPAPRSPPPARQPTASGPKPVSSARESFQPAAFA